MERRTENVGDKGTRRVKAPFRVRIWNRRGGGQDAFLDAWQSIRRDHGYRRVNILWRKF